MKAFISYSHHDAELLTALHQHLSALRRQNLLQTWTDRDIDAGGVLDSEIAAAMEEADLFLFLISSSFLNSDYCYEKEFKRALERHAAKKAIIVPIIVRPCDWHIPELRQFKALPRDGNPVHSKHWHSVDEAFENVATGLRTLLEKRSPKKQPQKPKAESKFEPDNRHISEEQRKELRKIQEEVVNRMAIKAATMPDAEAKELRRKWFGIIWSQFHEKFGTKENGLQSLPIDSFEAAKSWLSQYKGATAKKLKNIRPQAYRNTLTTTIYAIKGALNWSDEKLFAFAAEKLGCSPITSTDDLGDTQLETLRDQLKYEQKELGRAKGKTKAPKTPQFSQPSLPLSKELLELILAHPVEEEQGITEILEAGPAGPLNLNFITNSTAAGDASTVKKLLFTPAIKELLKLGWLLPPESDAHVRIYEFNPEARGLKT